MNYNYVVAGNVMLDCVRFADGSEHAQESIGGPATFAYSGVKLWTDEVLQCSNVGADYEPLFKPWIEKNDVITDGFKVICDRCNHSFLVYKEDGTYGAGSTSFDNNEEYKWLKHDAFQDFGYMKTKPEEIAQFTKDHKVKGVYVAQNADLTFWKKLSEIKKRDGFKLMWEIEGPWALKHYLDRVYDIARESVDIFSINIEEAQNLFEAEGDEECIRSLQTMDVDMTLFRVGARGAYIVTKDEAIHLPPAPLGPIIDPTGCGNTSTGGALYAYAEGYDPLMVGIMANISSGQNIRQFGVIPDFKKVRDESFALAHQLYKEYKGE